MRFSPIVDVHVDDELITFVLKDGRAISAPTEWSERLTNASDEQRRGWQIGGYGTDVSWPPGSSHQSTRPTPDGRPPISAS